MRISIPLRWPVQRARAITKQCNDYVGREIIVVTPHTFGGTWGYFGTLYSRPSFSSLWGVLTFPMEEHYRFDRLAYEQRKGAVVVKDLYLYLPSSLAVHLVPDCIGNSVDLAHKFFLSKV